MILSRLKSSKLREDALEGFGVCSKLACRWPGGSPLLRSMILVSVLNSEKRKGLPTYPSNVVRIRYAQLLEIGVEHELWFEPSHPWVSVDFARVI